MNMWRASTMPTAPGRPRPVEAIGGRGAGSCTVIWPDECAEMSARGAGATTTSPAGDPFEALGDPHRRAILALLAGGERSVGGLARELPISRPAVSRHLRLLREAGLVEEEPRGTQRIYRLHEAGLEAVRAYLEEVWGDAAARFRLLAENAARQPDGS
jgi:DNA-binding transcriptional ArsR family regulator